MQKNWNICYCTVHIGNTHSSNSSEICELLHRSCQTRHANSLCIDVWGRSVHSMHVTLSSCNDFWHSCIFWNWLSYSVWHAAQAHVECKILHCTYHISVALNPILAKNLIYWRWQMLTRFEHWFHLHQPSKLEVRFYMGHALPADPLQDLLGNSLFFFPQLSRNLHASEKTRMNLYLCKLLYSCII